MWFALPLAVLTLSVSAEPVVKPGSRALVAGDFIVQHDQADAVSKKWDAGCGPLVPPPVSARGAPVRIDVDEKTFAVVGAGRAFGSTRCEGENTSLAVLAAYVDGGRQVLRCRSKRVVKGTEETEHTLERLDDGRVKILATYERNARVRRHKCHAVVERHTILAPLVASTTSDIESPDTLQELDSASIERALTRELERTAQEAEVTTLVVTHTHAMSSDFDLLEAHYVLDGRELKESGRNWPMMRASETRTVFQDVVPPGVHVLEVELVYLTKVNGAPAKLRLKDAAFFDVVEKRPARLVLTGEQTGTMLTPLEKRVGMRFTLNGKPVER